MTASNRCLRLRAFHTFFLIIILCTLGLTPSQAVFGLGTCEKVKKQITQNEQVIYKEIQFWNSRVGTELGISLKNRWSNFEKNNYAKRIWKTAFNNKKCFTPSQILEINRRTNLEGKSEQWFLINFGFRRTGYGEECIGRELKEPIDLGKYSSGKAAPYCDIPPKFFVKQSEYPRSLYSY